MSPTDRPAQNLGLEERMRQVIIEGRKDITQLTNGETDTWLAQFINTRGLTEVQIDVRGIKILEAHGCCLTSLAIPHGDSVHIIVSFTDCAEQTVSASCEHTSDGKITHRKYDRRNPAATRLMKLIERCVTPPQTNPAIKAASASEVSPEIKKFPTMAAEQLKIASALLKDVMGKFHVCLDGQCDNEKQITIFFSRDKSAIGIVRRNQWQHTLWIAATQPEWIAINKVNAWITNDDKRACSSLSDEEQWLVLAIVQTFTHAQENIHAIDGTRVDEFTIEQTSAAKEDDSK